MKAGMKIPFLVALAALSCGLSLPASAAVTASLDRDEVASGESVQLVLQRDGRGGGEPDLAPLKKDFDVLDSSSNTSIQFVNGHLSAQRELRLTLAPKHAGTLQVPPLTWDGEQSNALDLTVSDGAGNAQSGGQGSGQGASQNGGAAVAHAAHVFLTSSIDQAQPYVQAGVLLTVQLHTDQQLYQASLDLPGNSDVLVQQVGKDQPGGETRNGRHYDVIERRYLLQPQRSGALSLDGPVLNAQVADVDSQNPFGGSPFAGMMGTVKPLRLHGDAIVLNVRPRPAAASGRDWLPARQMTLEEAWRPDSASVHVGEPLTLHLLLKAEGLTGAQLPDLSAELSLPDGLKAYPDQAKTDMALQAGGIVGSREQDIALIANRPGHYQLPALHLSWWDIKQDVQREVVLPERTLDILPAGGAPVEASPVPMAAPPAAPGDAIQAAPLAAAAALPARPPWPWIGLSLALGLLWLGTAAAWWRQRRRAVGAAAPLEATPATVAAPEAGAARKAFQQACRDNDPQAARRNLLAWARGHWAQNPPAGLNALAGYFDDPRLPALLQQLDRACYSGGAWQGGPLAQALGSLPVVSKRSRQAPRLGELYPP